MPTPSEKLDDALEELHGLQEKDLVAIKSTEISRVNRGLLVKTRYLSVGHDIETFAKFLGYLVGEGNK